MISTYSPSAQQVIKWPSVIIAVDRQIILSAMFCLVEKQIHPKGTVGQTPWSALSANSMPTPFMFLVKVGFSDFCLDDDKDWSCPWEEDLFEEGLGTLDLPTNLWGMTTLSGLPSGMGDGALDLSWYWNCRYDCCCMAACLETLSPVFIYSSGVGGVMFT